MAQARLAGLFAERYMIERELGHGASAVVYLAHDTKHDREIALKVLSKDLAHALGTARFLQEIHLTSRLHHPHILPIYDSGESNGLLYYVLPYVRGESLRDRMDREKQLPIDECVRITCELADALAHAHAAGVIHRDVKPENIMLADGHALLSDFGIARALDVHTGERLTSSGLIVGTSAYMSPEQASGEEKIDARSDIYSLGCVLYEMVAGIQPFIGPSTQAVIAQRFTHAPRPVRTYRPTVPEYLENVLERALAIAPADRYQTIKEFAADLGPDSTPAHDRRKSPIRRAVHGRQKLFGIAAAALVIISAAFAIANPLPGNWRGMFRSGAPLDSTKYAVIPIVPPEDSARPQLAITDGLYQALQSWKGLTLTDREAMTPRTAATLASALEIARKNGAGRLMVNDPLQPSEGPVRAALYEVTPDGGVKIGDALSRDSRDTAAIYSRIVVTLLGGADLPKRAAEAAGKTASLPAWQSYGRAHRALARWEIADAKREFRSSLSADPDFAPARLWIAMLNEWTTQPDTTSWKGDAVRAAMAASDLSPREAALAGALAALARRDFPAACTEYRAIASSDSLDFIPQYGMGECQALDDAVVPYAHSPSGWRFRSSYGSALGSYTRALRLDPGAYSLVDYSKLKRLLPIKSSSIRVGHPAESKADLLVAYPTLDHDTLAFIPYPAATFSALSGSAIQTHIPAIERNLETLIGLATEWTRSLPGSADAEEALADALEARGDVGRPVSGSRSASDAVARAMTLTRDTVQRVRLTATEVRLRIKRKEFSRARALADSLLAAFPTTSSGLAEELLDVAAGTGRIALTARDLVALSSATPLVPSKVGDVRVPEQVREASAALLAHAALGDCASASALITTLDDRLQTFVSENERAAVRAALVSRSLMLLGPCTGGQSALQVSQPKDRLMRMQQAFARNDRRTVARIFDTLTAVRRSERPADLSLDFTYQEAWLKLAMGDTASAVQQLDRALDAISTVGSLRDFAGAAALGRAMALRADIAASRRDSATARRLAAGVADLWAHADPELRPLVNRMRLLAASPGSP